MNNNSIEVIEKSEDLLKDLYGITYNEDMIEFQSGEDVTFKNKEYIDFAFSNTYLIDECFEVKGRMIVISYNKETKSISQITDNSKVLSPTSAHHHERRKHFVRSFRDGNLKKYRVPAMCSVELVVTLKTDGKVFITKIKKSFRETSEDKGSLRALYNLYITKIRKEITAFYKVPSHKIEHKEGISVFA